MRRPIVALHSSDDDDVIGFPPGSSKEGREDGPSHMGFTHICGTLFMQPHQRRHQGGSHSTIPYYSSSTVLYMWSVRQSMGFVPFPADLEMITRGTGQDVKLHLNGEVTVYLVVDLLV